MRRKCIRDAQRLTTFFLPLIDLKSIRAIPSSKRGARPECSPPALTYREKKKKSESSHTRQGGSATSEMGGRETEVKNKNKK